MDTDSKSELCQALFECVCDPDNEVNSKRGIIMDAEKIDRRNKDAKLDYLKKKYGFNQLFELDFIKNSAMIAASSNEQG